MKANDKKGTKRRTAMIKKMISLQWAPATMKTIQAIMKKHESSKVVLNTPWGALTGGIPRSITNSDVNALVCDFQCRAGYDNAPVKKAFLNKQDNLFWRSSGVPLITNRLSTTMVSKYICAMASHSGVSIVNKASNKI